MKTEILSIYENDYEYIISKAGEILKLGGLVSFPTETVYGLGANGLDPTAVKKIYKAKGRPNDNPLILHISDRMQLEGLVRNISKEATRCMDKFWPGPLTIIFKKGDLVPDIITSGLDTVAIRMPENKVARDIIKKSKRPIAAPSANLSGKPSPTKAEHVIEDLSGKVDMIIDGGNTGVGLESTVLDLSEETPVILRPGIITKEELEILFPNVKLDKGLIEKHISPKSPGQKYKHYAPKGEMYIIKGENDKVVDKIRELSSNNKNKRVGILTTNENYNKYNNNELVISLGERKNEEEIAYNLFHALRTFDNKEIEIIFSEAFESKDIGIAIMNRMEKAAGGKIIEV